MTVADRIEQRIREGSLPKPIPSWAVTAKHVCVWGGLGLTVAAGAASTAVSWWLITDPNGLIREVRASDWVQSALDLLPVAWIALSVGAGLFAYWLFAHTPHGYRYRRTLVIGCLAVGLLAFGGALYATNLAESIETAAAQLPGYEKVASPRHQVLLKPESGMIFGQVDDFGLDVWHVVDPEGEVWRITVVTSTNFPGNKRGQNQIRQTGCVRVFGAIDTSTHDVQAQAVRPCPRAVHLNAGDFKPNPSR